MKYYSFFSEAKLDTFNLNIWYIILAVIICMSFLFLLNLGLNKGVITCQCGQNVEKVDTISCYLCDKNVNKVSQNSIFSYISNCPMSSTVCLFVFQPQWKDGSHRRSCVNKKKAILDRMPRPLEVNCPTCKQVRYSVVSSF